MKRVLTLILTIAMTVASCTKEDKNGPYNRDGSPITQAQALKIVKNTIDEYDLVYITKSIVRKDVAFTTSLSVSGQTVVPYDSWIVMMDSDPLAEGGQKWIYISMLMLIRAKQGTILKNGDCLYLLILNVLRILLNVRMGLLCRISPKAILKPKPQMPYQIIGR